MPRIPYPDLDQLEPWALEILERARREGTPRPESQAIRAHVPDVLRTFTEAWERVFVNGVVAHELKELCRVYVTKTVQCGYCAAQRSSKAAGDEGRYDELLDYERSDRFTEREKAALAYTDAVVWDASLATPELWERLHRHFTVPELVELGFFIALTSGQQRWLKTLDLRHGEVLGDVLTGVVER
jgi:alkylhydroperoxidase family enzyme